MAQGIISDNWSLQDISSLFVYGMENTSAHEITVENGEHHFKDVSYPSIQTEALFDFLTDLVLRDEILVEEKFEHAWVEANSPILAAKELGVVRSYPFLEEPYKLVEPRNRIIEHMSSTESLKLAHQENVLSWKETKRFRVHFFQQPCGVVQVCVLVVLFTSVVTHLILLENGFLSILALCFQQVMLCINLPHF